jgi:DNA-directed RNA polymerase specialized sigma24 family protein
MREAVTQRVVALAMLDQSGEPTGFAEFVAPYVRMLGVLAVREVGMADADDVVQEALVRAWRRRVTFDPGRGSARA